MKLKDKEAWEAFVKANQDFYGAGVVRYAERWADLMEKELPKFPIKDIAEKTSHEADIEGITGFMYGCAVSILSKVWEHGEELRKWHNKEYDYEGDGCVNPAVITVNKI